MRPLELKLRNFRSYFGDGASFDFRNRRLVGIVGPIGSGKSTLLDAIAYALYGRTPAIGRSVKTLIHQRADNAAVSLRFEVDGEIWEVARSLRRKGASQHALYRLETDEPEAAQVEKITLEGDVNPRIESLLGLDFDAFGRSVLLAQGQFDEFLSARPAERDRVLKGVFGYEKIDTMQAIAKERVAALQVEAAELGGRLQQVETATARIENTRGELELTRQRLGELEKAADEISGLEERITAARDAHSAATKDVEALRAIESRVPTPESVAAAVAQVTAAADTRTSLAAKLEAAQDAYDIAQKNLDELEKAGEPQLVQRAGELIATLTPAVEALAKADRRLDEAGRRLAAAGAVIAEAAGRLETAERSAALAAEAATAARRAAEAAAVTFHDVQHADMAATLRGELNTGEPCPVCEQTVAVLPTAARDTDVEEAGKAAGDAAATAREAAEVASRKAAAAAAATEAVEGSRKAHAQAEETHAAEQRARTEAATTVDKLQADLADLLGPGDPAALLAARRDELRRTGEAVDAARRHRDDISEQHRRAVAAEHDAGGALGELRTTVVSLAGRLDEAIDPGDTAGQLTDAVDLLRRRLQDRLGSRETALAAAEDRGRGLRSELNGLLTDLGVGGSFAETLGATRAQIEMLENAVEADAELIESAQRMVEERAALHDRVAVFERLAKDLSNARFVRYLLDEERVRLAELGSEHFERLSSGRYRFTGDFDVVDLTAADAVRKADSLSGGETFLASLGLALALAEMVTRGGGRLDAFLLDEGFGTLDSEHLDLAMDGIESLVAADSDRLVVVVSHVPEMRHRIEDLIELDKSPVTGDTIVRRS